MQVLRGPVYATCIWCIKFTIIIVTIVKPQTIEDGDILVECYANINCGGEGPTVTTLEECCIHPEGNAERLSYQRDDVEGCLSCPLSTYIICDYSKNIQGAGGHCYCMDTVLS